jgi:hypothetical protein
VLSAQTGSFKNQIPQRLAGASFGRPAPLLHYVFKATGNRSNHWRGGSG